MEMKPGRVYKYLGFDLRVHVTAIVGPRFVGTVVVADYRATIMPVGTAVKWGISEAWAEEPAPGGVVTIPVVWGR